VVDEDEHIEPAEQERVYAEEVAGHDAVARRNSAQLGPDRRGDGSMPWRLRIAQTLDAAMVMPTAASSPWTVGSPMLGSHSPSGGRVRCGAVVASSSSKLGQQLDAGFERGAVRRIAAPWPPANRRVTLAR
jgi:hypothetical protein